MVEIRVRVLQCSADNTLSLVWHVLDRGFGTGPCAPGVRQGRPGDEFDWATEITEGRHCWARWLLCSTGCRKSQFVCQVDAFVQNCCLHFCLFIMQPCLVRLVYLHRVPRKASLTFSTVTWKPIIRLW